MINELCPQYYLKVAPKQEEHSTKDISAIIAENHSKIHESNSSGTTSQEIFGWFKEIFRTSDWAVLYFGAMSRDCGFKDSVYSTSEKSLAQAIKYLENRGYDTKSFDLERMIDQI